MSFQYRPRPINKLIDWYFAFLHFFQVRFDRFPELSQILRSARVLFLGVLAKLGIIPAVIVTFETTIEILCPSVLMIEKSLLV